MSHHADDLRWLATPAATEQLQQLANQPTSEPSLVVQLRRHFTAEQTHLLLEQTELRRRAQEKFPQAERMLFTRRGLEQATDHFTAAFKAGRFPAEAAVVDLCCGIGGDALALANRGSCLAVDLDPNMVWLAEFNAEALGTEHLQATCATAASIEIGEGYWHIDPDRRAEGRRHTRVEGYQPGLEFLRRLVGSGGGGAIKLAPAAVVPEELAEGCQLQWISRGGECKQLVAWYGNVAQEAGQRTASVLSRDGKLLDEFTARHDAAQHPLAAESLGRYLYDPDAALLAAQLVPQLASERGLRMIDQHSCYLTSDRLFRYGSLAAFEVLEHLPLDVRRLRQVLEARGIGRLELKKRAAPVELPRLGKQLRTKGGEAAAVIITPWQGSVVAVVCRRVVV